MAKVFISHSKKDFPLISNVAKMLKNIGEVPIVMEYMPKEDEKIPPHDLIRKNVQNSDYMMLFKTDNAIKSDYTKNWIIFEVGLAASEGKRLFVFERKGRRIKFPIPYLTDYMIFEPGKVEDFLKMQSIIKEMKGEKTTQNDDTDLSPLLLYSPELLVVTFLKGIASAFEGPQNLTCPNCSSNYKYYGGIFYRFNCPVCLRDIHWQKEAKKRMKKN